MSDHKEFCPELGAGDSIHKTVMEFIQVVEEPPDMYENTGIYENCVFCDDKTKFWHQETNNAVCKDCSCKHKVSELKNWRAGNE